MTPNDATPFSDLGLPPRLLANLERAGYQRTRPIQATAIPAALAGRDVIGLARTGYGKTVAFLAPLIAGLITDDAPTGPTDRLRALVLCPTRELAEQVAAEAQRLTSGTRRRVGCVFGKVGMRPQVEMIAAGVDLLVGTPGRVRDLVAADALSLASVRRVAIDEADRMLDLGFLPQVSRLLASIPDARQTLLFTATMPPAIEKLAGQFLRDPERHEADRESTPVDHVERTLVRVDERDKVPLLLHLLAGRRKRGGVLVFCRTRRRVGWVVTALRRNGVPSDSIHGDRSQAQRRRALDRFIAGDVDVLIATDVASRGLHIEAVRAVINYDVPTTPEDYVHRIGRAGHGGGHGEATTLLSAGDEKAWSVCVSRLGERMAPTVVAGWTPSVDPERPAAESPRRAAPGSGRGETARRGGGPGRSPSRVRRRRDGEESEEDRLRRKGKRMRTMGRGRARNRPIPPGESPGGGVRGPKSGE